MPELAAAAGTLSIRLADPAQRPLAGTTLRELLNGDVRESDDPLVLTAAVARSGSGTAGSEHAAAALTGLVRAGITVTEFALGQPSLDEVFLTLTGQPGDRLQTRTEATP